MTILDQPPADFYCSQLALESTEMMAGTAVSAPVWVLLEYRQTWRAKATSDNTLPELVKNWLDEQLTAVNGRLQFIRQTPSPEQLNCFIAIPDIQKPRLYRFTFNEYDDLLPLDLASIVANPAQYTPHRVTDPLFLVCTNGKRDRCCAKFGMVVYQALSAAIGTAVWQTTHLGGHRFAPTLMSFPEGICYGHVTIDDIPQLLSAQQRDELYLPKLRGRAMYDAVTQVAEYFLCRETNHTGLKAFQHLHTRSHQENNWSVQFHQSENGHKYQVDITEGPQQSIYASCDNPSAKPVPTYSLQQITPQY